jgi:biotin carboxyl carrier protein
MVKGRIKDQEFEIVWDKSLQKMFYNGQARDWNFFSQQKLMHLNFEGKSYKVEWLGLNKDHQIATVKVNGTTYALSIEQPFDGLLQKMGFTAQSFKKLKDIKAPMPGLVVNVLIKEGDEVVKDTPLFVLEAMKMENMIKSPVDGVIKKVNTIKGQAVEKGMILLEFN